jgi:16S rRNA (cytidine1402-2'-O)-methyltransferase
VSPQPESSPLSRQLAPPALSDAPLAPGLYLVATPIGNLRDITLRALDVLAGCDVLLAEDTRVSGKLLAAYAISKRLQRYDEHVADRETPRILERLEAGERVALVSDAGTPMVSDPGCAWPRRRSPPAIRCSRSPAPRRPWRP